uniref:Ycf2 protein n=1 Tax=Hanabusaya asiatica TaxID=103032 RepID=A0A075DZ68_9ASTR|nr:Ycf2 protein [Hanabusaya asiatica]AHY94462.1 Ycf2 protein [Hanabusaya asiatica]
MNTFKIFLGEFRAVLREKKNSPSNPFTSVGYFIRIFFDPRRLIKLFDPLVWRVVLLYTFNPPGLTVKKKIRRFCNLTIKSGIFFVVAVLISRMINRPVETDVVLVKLFPIPMNFIEPKNDTVEHPFVSSHVDRLLISLVSPPKGNKIGDIVTQRESQQLIKERSILGDPSVLETEQAETEQAETEQAETEQAETEQAEDSVMSRLWEEIEQLSRNRTRSVSSFFSDGWVELQLSKRLTRDQKLLKNDNDFSVFLRAENTEILKLFKIIPYLHNTVSIHPIPISSDPSPSDDTGTVKPLRDNNEKFNKMTELETRLVKRIDFLEKKITETQEFCRDGPIFPTDSYGYEYNLEKFFQGPGWVSKKMIFIATPPSSSEENAAYYRRMIKKGQKQKRVVFANKKIMEIVVFANKKIMEIVVFANKKIMEAANQHRLIRNLIQSTTYRSIRNVWNRFLLLTLYGFEFRLSKYTINRHLGNQYSWDRPSQWKNTTFLMLIRGNWFQKHFGSEQKSPEDRFKFSFGLLTPLFLDDHEPCQKISESMIHSLYENLPKTELKSFRASLPKTYSDLSMIFDDPDNWLNPVKPFHRSSLISAFFKANRLRFMNKPDYFSFYCNKRFPFYVEKAPINYYNLIYRQFLNTLFIRNKKLSLGVGQKPHAFSERDILSAIQSEVSKRFKSLDFPRRFDPFIGRVSYSILDNPFRGRASASIVDIPLKRRARTSIIDISGTPLTEEQIVNLERTYCQPLSDINFAHSEGTKLHQSCSDINLSNLKVPNFGEFLSNINLANLEATKLDESLSNSNLANLEATKLDESLSYIDLDDLEGINFDEYLSDRNLYDLESKNFDESLSDRNLYDLESKNFDESLSDINLANLKVPNFGEFLSDINLANLKVPNFGEFLSDINLANLKVPNFGEFRSDINLDDLDGTNFADSLLGINLADSERPDFYDSLFDINIVKLKKLTRFRKGTSWISDIQKNSTRLVIPPSLFEKFLSVELEKRLKEMKKEKLKKAYEMLKKYIIWRKKKQVFLRKEQIRQIHLIREYKEIMMYSKKLARSKKQLVKKYISYKKWKLFKSYLPLALTSQGFKFLTSLFLEIVFNLRRKVWTGRRFFIPELTFAVLRWKSKWRMKWRMKWRNWRNWRNCTRNWISECTRNWISECTMKWTNFKEKWKMKFKNIKNNFKNNFKKWETKFKNNFKKWETIFKKGGTIFKKWDAQMLKLTFVFNFNDIKNGIKTAWHYGKLYCYEIQHRHRHIRLRADRKRKNLYEFHLLMSFFLLILLYLVYRSLLECLFCFLSLLGHFKMGKSLIMDELMIEIELEELLAEYPLSQSPHLGLRFKNFCLGLIENMLFPSPYALRKRRFLNINFGPIINLINIISNEINFVIRTRSISSTSKEIYSFLRKRKKVAAYWNQTADWVSTHPWVEDEEREVLMQFVTFRRKTRISEILWSLTSIEEPLRNNEVLPQMVDQPGEVYLRKVIDFHKKYLLNYEFNTSSLAEKRIFLALYHTMTYSQTSSGVDPFPVLSRPKPFSLRLNLAPSKSILLIGSIGLGRSYLVNYLAKDSYLPFITILLHKYGQMPSYFDDEWLDSDEYFDEYFEDDGIGILEDLKIFVDTRDDLEMLSEDIQTLDHDTDESLFWSHFMLSVLSLTPLDYHFDAEADSLEQVSLTDQSEDMETVPYAPVFYSCLQMELAKAMSPCLIWIPNIHEVTFEDSDFFTLGLLAYLLSWDCERSSSSNNLIIASTHMPQRMQPCLIDPGRFNTCIKVRRPIISQQQKNFLILSYTRGFRLDSQIFDTTNGFESITLGSTAQDLVALTNEALSLSLSQGKSIIDSNTLRHALHRQTWDLRAELRPINNSRVLFYQIGRVVVHYFFLRDCPIDPISIYMNNRFCPEREPYLYRWYYQLGMSMKKLTILIYVLNCSSGLVAQNLWSRSDLNANNEIASGSLVENNSDLVHGLLEVEGILEGFLPTEKDCSQFDKDRVPVLRRPEPRNPSDMIHNGFWSLLDQKLIYEKDPSAPPILLGGIKIDPHKVFENFIVWAPRKWSPWGFLLDWLERANANELGFPYWSRGVFAKEMEAILFNSNQDNLEENDPENDSHSDEDEQNPLEEKEQNKEKSTFYKLEDDYVFADAPFNPFDYDNLFDDEHDEVEEAFLKSVYKTRTRIRSCQEQIFFGITQFIWDPGNPLLSLSDDPSIAVLFSPREFTDTDLDEEKWFFTGDIKTMEQSWFVAQTQEKHCQWLIQRHRLLRRPNNSLSKGSFRSTALAESYQYLSNWFRSKRTLVNQLQKLLVKKRWLFPDDMQKFFAENYHHTMSG